MKMAEVDDYGSIDGDQDSTTLMKKQLVSADEDTDDASETDRAKREEATEIKEQMYREKLAQIKQQASQLLAGTLPEFCRKQKKLEQIHKECQKQLQVYQAFLRNKIEKEFKKDQDAAIEEFQAKKIELKETLIAELQDKKKQIENERNTIELTGTITSSMETKAVTRKLRRRANEPAPAPSEKRRKASPTQLNFTLTEDEIADDLKVLNKGKALKPVQEVNFENNIPPVHQVECRVDHGKLLYDKRWFHTGQPVFLEHHKEGTRISGLVTAITDREIWIQKASDGAKVRVYVSQLHRGKCSIKKRTMQ